MPDTSEYVTGLTRDEAAARAALISVQSYDVRLDLTDLAATPIFRSDTTIRFTAREARAGDATFVELAAERVEYITLNGVSIDPSKAVHGNRIELRDLAADNELRIRATHTDTASRAGLHRAVDPADHAVYAWTTFEPYDAHRVFACFDQPDLKATYTFRVRVPGGWRCVSNSPVSAVDRDEWTFAPTPRLPSYVTVVCAGPFHEARRQHGDIDLGLFCRASLADRLDEDELFEVTAQGLDFFGEQFAMPYPLDKYDQVFLPDFPGAMENLGCVTWTDREVFRSAPTAAQLESRAIVLLHEMAHMWFGDIVTMRWWEDLWLNESFADWAAVWAAVNATRYTDAWATFLQIRKERGYAADDCAATTHPVRRDVPDTASATAGFDMITYAKGASLLKQLVAWVGEDAFVRGLRHYFARFAWSNVEFTDLLDELEAAAGADVRAWSRQWLETAGHPILELKVNSSTGENADVAVRQSLPAGAEPRQHRLVLSAYEHLSDGRMERRDRYELRIGAAHTAVPDLAGQPRADLLLLNDEDLAFAKVRPDADSVRAFLGHGWQLPSAIARAVVRLTLWQLMEDALLPASEVVGYASHAIGHETHGPELQALIERSAAAASWAPTSMRDELLARVADACLDLASVAHGERRITALRGLAAAATTEAQLAALRELSDAADTGQNDRASADLRWRALIRLAAYGRTTSADVARAVAADTDPDAAARALAVRAALPNAEAKAEAWQELVVDKSVPWNAAPEVARAFWQSHQEQVLTGYPRRYLESLTSADASEQWMTAAAIARVTFPFVAVGPDFVDEVTAAADRPSVPPHVRHEVLERADVLARMLRAREVAQGASR